MTEYLSRMAWGAREPRDSTKLVMVPGVQPAVEGIALHWPGMEKPLGRDRIEEALRGWQDYHMDDRGWSDIAYQTAIDQWGRVWTLRGLTTRSAANGDEDVNKRFGAVLLILAPGEVPTPAMIEATRDVIRLFRGYFPHATKIVPHSLIRPASTDCPGDRVRAMIASGTFTPSASKDETMTPEQFAQFMDVQNKILTEVRGINARVGYLANEGAQDLDEIRDKIVGTPE